MDGNEFNPIFQSADQKQRMLMMDRPRKGQSKSKLNIKAELGDQRTSRKTTKATALKVLSSILNNMNT